MKTTQTELPPGVEKARIWDLGLRLFHWALVICVVTGWLLGRYGPSIMTLHFYAGYAVIGLVAYRLVWGFVGPRAARFVHFIYGPGTTLNYLRNIGARKPSYWPGHNPMGALSVFAILAVLIFQTATGLFADPDDFINVGPLAKYVATDTAQDMARLHYRGSLAILALVVLHIGAIVFYKKWKNEDLIRPMITGWKLVRRDRQG
ncbi:cytochrome b/b6 domain-containing protein [Actibacterium ureilyticum]|uniref:cytochrome b/b6 domain-containing protein n=1 Tax=Actibacterium ureilyticum TaxID=1590614 RepID=UPI000BAAA8B0|nr:cytochrome b/b6 domain-containing protein [Actibacterium ureilyticum]